MRAVIVHEWLEPRGGAEKVVDAMLEAFPNSELYTLWDDAPEKYPGAHESWLAHTPMRRHKALALPLEPSTWRHVVPAIDANFALVSSHLFAHHVSVCNREGERLPKFVYAHTPARYIWEPNLDRRGSAPAVRAIAAALKPVDRRRAHEATKIAANSKFVRDRIRRTWLRDADVIYPPVDIEVIESVSDWRNRLTNREQDEISAIPAGYLLGASRFVPYKRLDWVIRAGSRLHLPVVIAGSGPEEQSLRRLARELDTPVSFVVAPSAEMLYSLYQQAQVFAFPPVEDFGIMPVEAMAAGTPVVVSGVGGASESVRLSQFGVVAEGTTFEDFERAVHSATSISRSRPDLRCFGRNRFCTQLREWSLGAGY